MPSTSFIVITIILCGLVTWASRSMPFAVLKKVKMPKSWVEFLSFVPIVIMSLMWFEGLFTQHLGHFPSINYPNLFASAPTVLSAVLTKNLLVIVLVGAVSLAIIKDFIMG